MYRLAFALVLALGLVTQVAPCQSEGSAQITRESFPTRWEVKIPVGSALAQIRDTYEKRRTVRMVSTELQDQSPLPFWFRAYVRDHLPELPTSGSYQYPRVTEQILQWMLAHPDLKAAPPVSRVVGARAVRSVTVGGNINISNLDERNSESAIAVDPSSPQILIAASNNITGDGRQKQFYSADSGATWHATELPLATGSAFDSDPTVGFTTDGTAWAATLGINNTGTAVATQVFKSTDHGATWSFVATISNGNNNDKEMMWIDTQPGSAFKDNIYLAWDVPGSGIRFARSTDKGITWSSVMSLSSDGAIGVDLRTGPAGELYVAWPDTNSRQLKVRASTDGGASFGPVHTIAVTNTPYEIAIPAMCQRNALIYLSIGVDRSGGARKGNLYASWTDKTGTAPDPGCGGVTSTTSSDVFAAVSSDNGNTWSTPKVVHGGNATSDQFNQWMDVDPDDGTVHVVFYDTRDDPGRVQSHVYYVASRDGGSTWVDETKVTSAQTDETVAGADTGNQYGDYNGLVAYRKAVYPSWTDRRTGVPGGKEQIFTAKLGTRPPNPAGTLPACLKSPQLCVLPQLAEGEIILKCLVRPCMVVDLVPKNCLVKYACPGCPPDGLCPPWYEMHFQGLDDSWSLNLLGPKGESIPHQTVKTQDDVVLSFRPSKSRFKSGSIGNYFLTFRLRSAGKTGMDYKVKTSLKVGDKPFSGGK
jgi:hypothetical protein